MKQLIRCGCGNHYVNNNDIIEWQNKSWHPFCVFPHLHAEVAKLTDNNQKQIKNRLRKIAEKIAHMHCDFCHKDVGKSFCFFGSGIYCTHCLFDFGGEG